LVSLHEHSGKEKIAQLVERLKAGESGAYISDAGTPGICDPGQELVLAAAAEGIKIYPVPGASAPVSLLSVSGFSSSEFSFHGFFPRENGERKALAEKLETQRGLHVFFESPHRFHACLYFLAGECPRAQLVIGRELTKVYESLYRGTAAALWEELRGTEPRGEYVLAIQLEVAEEAAGDERELLALLTELKALGADQKVLTRVAQSHGLARNAAYQLALNLQKS
jgi:16S rRNA (cytidine1402-2'-O)-methyltransferase